MKRRKARSNRLRVVYTWFGEQEIPQDERWNYCNKVLGCGHECDGIRDEPECLPCLHPDCGAQTAAEALKREIACTIDDACGICFAGLSEAPCVRVCKNHIFHASCVKVLLESGWSTMSISFSFLNCPTCKNLMKIHPETPVIG